MVHAKRGKLEIEEEKAVILAAKEMGIASLKFTPTGQRGWPDRIFFIPGGKPAFLEFKRPGEKLRKLQAYRMAQLRSWGYTAKWYDNRYDAIKFLHRMVTRNEDKNIQSSQLPETCH
jgi:hypothetical protein